MAKPKGSKKVVCRCGQANYLLPGTARGCSGCGRMVRVNLNTKKTKKQKGGRR